jgi:hypothetical protein
VLVVDMCCSAPALSWSLPSAAAAAVAAGCCTSAGLWLAADMLSPQNVLLPIFCNWKRYLLPLLLLLQDAARRLGGGQQLDVLVVNSYCSTAQVGSVQLKPHHHGMQ